MRNYLICGTWVIPEEAIMAMELTGDGGATVSTYGSGSSSAVQHTFSAQDWANRRSIAGFPGAIDAMGGTDGRAIGGAGGRS